VKLIIQM